MLKIYQEEMFLRTSMCDALGAWRPDAILECMQETAGAHSALLGLGRDVMDRMGVCWILSRVKVEMHRVPHALEKITVETWPMPTRHLFFPRSHVFCDEKGDVIGCANSLWMVMDLESRRVVKNDFVAAHMPDTSDFKSAAGIPATVRALAGEKETSQYSPVFTDFDLNRHVNNTKYMAWCLNALGAERLEKQCVQTFDVNYDAEILPGTQVQLELCEMDGAFSFLGFADEKQRFAVSGRLVQR